MRAIELFSGAGGLGLGATMAGIDVVLAVEADRDAAQTYKRNHPETTVLNEKIDAGWDILDALSRAQVMDPVDLLLGGPPCQGWSSLGARADKKQRAKLNECVTYFLSQVKSLRPRAFVMENVRGLHVADKGERLAALTSSLDEDYEITSGVLKAADFGVPQLRHRLFVVGVRRDLNVAFSLPEPIRVAGDYVTVRDAIGDLPALAAGQTITQYAKRDMTGYQKRMRGDRDSLLLHTAPDHPASLVELLARVGEGQARSDLDESVRPASGFHNTYGRMRWDEPAPAVTASIGRVSSGRHTHPRDHRALSPREAARLQGFPDDFEWEGRRWAVYKMIGNAVPPDLAKAVLSRLVETLDVATTDTEAQDHQDVS